MTTKAQDAALLLLRKQEKKLMGEVRNRTLDSILAEVQSMGSFAREYHLDGKLMNEIVKGIYGLLMDGERYAEAADLAKKYRL